MPSNAARRLRKRASGRLAAAAAVALSLALGLAFAAPARAAAPAAPSAARAVQALAGVATISGGVPHTVTFDKYSLMIDGQRAFIWSGEFDAFRLPSPSLWRDILEKMKSNGYNAVTIYFDWGYHSPAPGVYDFTGVRDMDELLDMADQAGIYVIARPGPYINGETDAGGFPDWLAEFPGTDRTNDATYLTYSDQWQSAIDAIIARHQLTNGAGSVILYQIENEYANNLTSQAGIGYMAHLYAKARADGITVPIFHNDKGRNGDWVPGSFPETPNDGNYLYAFDGYPGGMCHTNGSPGTPSAPPDWGYYGTGGRTGGATASPNTPGFWAESGTGWFDNWGGVGYSCLNTRLGPAYETTEGLTAIANGIKIQSPYMTFGGTNWGWLPADVVYTSYDYGAPFNEARQPTAKVGAMKELGYFVQSVTPIDKMDPGPVVSATSVSPAGATVKVYHDVNPDTGTGFYIVRNDSSDDETFTLPISTQDGSFTIPEQGSLELNGIDAKIITAGYDFGSQHLVYSTSQIMTQATVNGEDIAVFDGRSGQSGETMMRFSSQPNVQVLTGSADSTWDAASSDLRLDYTTSGLTEVLVTGGGTSPLLLIFGDDAAANSFWRLDTPAGPVLVRGPDLLRTASVSGSQVDLTGDTAASDPLEVWAPGAASVTWNGQPVATAATAAGSLLAGDQLAGPPTVSLPALTNWVYQYETPEAQPAFDDSSWAVADKTSSNSKTPIPAGQPDLFADDYGFHHGDVWYRGTYSGASAATAVNISYQAGGVGMMEAWLDGTFLGSSQLPTPAVYSTSPVEAATATFQIPAAMQTDGTHHLSVIVRMMGHSEDGNSNNANKAARGLTAVGFAGSSAPISWKIQGNEGGEDLTDTVRGPMNNGGLYGERAGWYLPGYPDGTWTPVSLPDSDPQPGVAWYRTTFTLNEPAGVDASLGLTISDVPTKAYRATIFLNGWNMGQYINNVGPQHTFVLPNGILRTGIGDDGQNTLAIAVITNSAGGGAAGGGLGNVSLTNLGTVAGGVSVTDVDSPGYAAPTATAATITPRVGTPFSGLIGHVSVPADARGTELAASVDWGDGTSSAATLAPAGDGYDVHASHTYAADAAYPVSVTVTDAVDQQVLATATGTAYAYEFAPGGGTFVVGDQSATGPVLFWGDIWWQANSLSGGQAPAEFKGFAAAPAVPACGTGWETKPGASSAPPAGPLPEYLGVIAASSVSSAGPGSSISGDTGHIVVVRTGSGYGPLPTEHGTGTVVATAC
ncbi:MAG TPA: beta-galactosidase [Trebonia sp.]|jgi:beta-galactosidase GanA